MDYKKLQAFKKSNQKLDESIGYKGIPIAAASNLHEKVFELVEKYNFNKNINILILGSGAGAFDLRLLDNGYTNITSVEFVEGAHIVPGVKLLNNDLNKDFYTLGKFDLIIALEIIEHLENQFHFMRNIEKCLDGDGAKAIISTPNIESSFSRVKFFFIKKLQYFSKEELTGTGHINPILRHVLEFNIKTSGLKLEECNVNQNVWKGAFSHKNYLIRLLYIPLYILSRFIFKRDKSDGEISIYIIAKK